MIDFLVKFGDFIDNFFGQFLFFFFVNLLDFLNIYQKYQPFLIEKVLLHCSIMVWNLLKMAEVLLWPMKIAKTAIKKISFSFISTKMCPNLPSFESYDRKFFDISKFAGRLGWQTFKLVNWIHWVWLNVEQKNMKPFQKGFE